eukprot:TRINITY_DN1409_c0_g1_i4.p1 TRINITY_DN1409_c0_g1~~TRINITY_DN1409_c0_g1_i4.p1  ORF type:complete len:202 (+),score=43.61 TRINITY_DN1409_c0_g1_i4:429-1034(+)
MLHSIEKVSVRYGLVCYRDHPPQGKAFSISLCVSIEITNGKYLTLQNAHLLADVVVGGSAEELDLKKFEEEILRETLAVRKAAPTLSTEEVEEAVERKLASCGVQTYQLNVTHQKCDAETRKYSKMFAEASCLSELKPKLASESRERETRVRSTYSASPMSIWSDEMGEEEFEEEAQQQAMWAKCAINKAQIQSVLKRNKM